MFTDLICQAAGDLSTADVLTLQGPPACVGPTTSLRYDLAMLGDILNAHFPGTGFSRPFCSSQPFAKDSEADLRCLDESN